MVLVSEEVYSNDRLIKNRIAIMVDQTRLIKAIRVQLNKEKLKCNYIEKSVGTPDIQVGDVVLRVDVSKPFLELDNKNSKNMELQRRVWIICANTISREGSPLFIHPVKKMRSKDLRQPVTHDKNIIKAHQSIISRKLTKNPIYYESIEEQYNVDSNTYQIFINDVLFGEYNDVNSRERLLGKLLRAEKGFYNFLENLQTKSCLVFRNKKELFIRRDNNILLHKFNLILKEDGFGMKIVSMRSKQTLIASSKNPELLKEMLGIS